ncbi:MAG TPA: ClpXP protease specificity-enhancing factor [Spongiibacteraceae bacterium]|nr:ClpXP protease specificity-enhancing factor [Spongiibacteraceae bacterium]
MAMTSSRPYLTRALYEWIVDNGCTPYVVVNANRDDVQVPRAHVKDGQIVLNIAPAAVVGLKIDNDAIEFNARFGGVAMQIYVPMGAVLGIYARENGQGMIFEPEEPPANPPPASDQSGSAADNKKPDRPGLKIVK